MDLDVDTTKQAIDIARQAATKLNSAVSVVDRLKTMFKPSEPPPMDEVRETVTCLRDQIMDAREVNVSLREVIGDLRDEMIELKRKQEKFAGYELWETPTGHHIYRSTDGVEPLHYLCPHCHDAGVKTVLQGSEYIKDCRATPGHGSFKFEPRPAKNRPTRVGTRRPY